MLFTDSDIITAAQLAAIDSEVQVVARTTKPPILIEGDGSICALAWQECGRKVLQAMQSYVSYPAQTGMPATHIAAVTNVGVPARTQPRVRLNQIIAGEVNYAGMDSAIERWIQYHALYLFFRDASARMGNDRLEEKMVRYEEAAKRQWNGLRNEGLPMIYHPFERPGAKHAYAAGSWGDSNVSSTAGGSSPSDQQVLVAITWTDSSNYVSQEIRNNAESAPSDTIVFTIPAGNLLQVDISSLNPPSGKMEPVGLAQGLYAPMTATHWNLWVGLNGSEPLYLQAEGIPITTKSYTLADDPAATAYTMGRGQYPDLNLVFSNLVMRG